MEQITPTDIDASVDHPDYTGWGYLGHERRTARTDAALADAANQLGLAMPDLFAWMNSRLARHDMDVTAGTVEAFLGYLGHDLPILHAELAR